MSSGTSTESVAQASRSCHSFTSWKHRSIPCFQFAQPQFRSQADNLQMGFLYEAQFNFDVPFSGGPAHVIITLDPSFDVGLRPSDGLIRISSLGQNVSTEGLDVVDGIFSTAPTPAQIQGYLKTLQLPAKGNKQPVAIEDMVNATLSPLLSQVVPVLGMRASDVTTTCQTPTPAAPSQECFDNVIAGIHKLASSVQVLPDISVIASQVLQPINFTCDPTNQCRFHPVFQAVNVLPDRLEVVLAPDLRNPVNPFNDLLDRFFSLVGPFDLAQKVTIGGSDVTVSLDCSVPQTKTTPGTIATVFTGDSNLAAGIKCGGISQP
jgi:hypothetical protein